MSNSNSSQGGSDKKRNLPSWMGSGENRKKPTNSGENEESKEPTEINPSKKSKESDSSLKNFSKLMDGVVFALSGFVNPERASLRSQALEMGADYRQDWDSRCTLLVCAYSNTPKFRQVEADNGTIVKKEWITDCYSQKKLVEIDSYLMHAGKPWKKGCQTTDYSRYQKPSPPKRSTKQVERGSHPENTISSSSKSKASSPSKVHFPPSEVKEWAAHDLNKTILWLESQEEKPEPSEMKEIASEGIKICLQDAIESLEKDQDIGQIAEQWNIVPKAVEELIKLVDAGKSSATFSKGDLCKQFKECKRMYEVELNKANKNKVKSDAADCDSDETVEMTEEEIDLAYNNFASTLKLVRA